MLPWGLKEEVKIPGKGAKEQWLEAEEFQSSVLTRTESAEVEGRSCLILQREINCIGCKEIIREVAYMKAEEPEFVLRRRACIPAEEGVLWN